MDDSKHLSYNGKYNIHMETWEETDIGVENTLENLE